MIDYELYKRVAILKALRKWVELVIDDDADDEDEDGIFEDFIAIYICSSSSQHSTRSRHLFS
jgi:hypothetical protein